jgi:hypothetical protein
MKLNDPLWETTHLIVLLTAATVACGVVCNKSQKKKKERKDVMGHLLFGVLPILVLLLVGYRTGYLLTIFISVGIIGIIELSIYWLLKHGKPDFKLRAGLYMTVLGVSLSGFLIVPISVFLFLMFYYTSACEWIEKYILGR